MVDRIPPELAEAVRLVVLDVDGVLTDNGIYIGETADGVEVELKRFDVPDGLGIRMLVSAGIAVVLVSGRESVATRIRADELGVRCYQNGGGFKLDHVRDILAEHGLGWEDVAAVADDLADLPVMRRVGFPVAVANAVPEVLAAARWRTTRSGGRGAVREFAEAILRARGEWNELVDDYCRERETAGVEHGG